MGSFHLNIKAAQIFQVTAVVSEDLDPEPSEDDTDLGPRIVPSELRRFLARLRLLEGVPFCYLVPDA